MSFYSELKAKEAPLPGSGHPTGASPNSVDQVTIKD